MKNSILTHYVTELNKLLLKNPNDATKRAVKQLITELPKQTDVDSLLQLLWSITGNQEKDVSAAFYDKLSGWIESLIKLDEVKVKAIEHFDDLESDHSLKKYLLMLLKDDRTIFHIKANSLFNLLTDEKISDIFSYIITLPAKPNALIMTKGSFFSIKPVNEDHKACIQLLANVCSKIDNDNDLSMKANGLLQTALSIHLDFDLEEVSFELARDESCWCTLL